VTWLTQSCRVPSLSRGEREQLCGNPVTYAERDRYAGWCAGPVCANAGSTDWCELADQMSPAPVDDGGAVLSGDGMVSAMRIARAEASFAIRYVPTYVKQAVGQRDSATLVRGVDAYQHFDPEPRPKADLHPDAMAFHRAITENQLKVLYRGTEKTEYRP